MATTAPTPIPPSTSDRIPCPTIEIASSRPGNAKFGFVPIDFPAKPDAKGNRGMAGVPPREANAEEPEGYVPFTNLRRGGL